MSMPFDGQIFTFQNPDGSEVTLRGWGNQHYAVFEDLEGYTVTRDPDSGFYHYAELSDDSERLVATPTRVGEASPADLEFVPGVRIRRRAAREQAAAGSTTLPDNRRWTKRREEKKAQARAMPERGELQADGTPAPPPGATTGTYVGLCLLIQFPDVAGTITTAQVEDFCNQPGYSGFGNNGSVRDYFRDVSDNTLTYTNIVTAYYTASHNRSYYTDESQPNGSRARQLIDEALDSLVADGFDFSGLSSDGSGFIYALNVYYAGPNVNNWSKGLWPHAWALPSPYNVGGGKKFNDYQITNMGAELTLRTFCHENGHMICDFPDLYDYGGESNGPGHFCLMGYGGNNKNPTQVGAYLKNAAGWTSSITPISAGSNGSVTAGTNDFYIHNKNGTEYFIVENRQKTGRDAALPDHGLAIWHVDETGSNNNEQMTPSMHYECSLIQADNRFDLEGRSNAGDADDLFSSPGVTTFDDNSGPDARWWDGSNSGLLIDQISASGPTMTFTTGGAPPDNGIPGVYLLLLS
ncbi:MAG: M6 family metalloprotease domain-containing protein [Acidimicrobiales bacterium]